MFLRSVLVAWLLGSGVCLAGDYGPERANAEALETAASAAVQDGREAQMALWRVQILRNRVNYLDGQTSWESYLERERELVKSILKEMIDENEYLTIGLDEIRRFQEDILGWRLKLAAVHAERERQRAAAHAAAPPSPNDPAQAQKP